MRHQTLALSTLLLCTTADAAEHVLLAPKELTFQASGSSPWQQWFPNTVGKSWKKPDNYVDGQFHMRCLARELARPTELQVCIYWDGAKGKHSCAKSRVRLEKKGDFIAVSSTPATWWCSEPQNWSNIGPKFRILMRDGLALSKISAWKSYFPLKVNCTVVLVSQGATFSGWGNYPFANMPGTPPAGTASDAGASGPPDVGVAPDGSTSGEDLGPAAEDGPGQPPTDQAVQTPDQAARAGDGAGPVIRGSDGCSFVPTPGADARGTALLTLLLLALFSRPAARRCRRRARGDPVGLLLPWTDVGGGEVCARTEAEPGNCVSDSIRPVCAAGAAGGRRDERGISGQGDGPRGLRQDRRGEAGPHGSRGAQGLRSDVHRRGQDLRHAAPPQHLSDPRLRPHR
jgi:hypothetical protein